MIHGLTSIIIPTFNHAAYVGDAIASALEQTAPVEVIVVDDGSTDDTLALCGKIVGAMRDARLVVCAVPHGGPSHARNHGLKKARGEFVMFLDADDVIAPDKVARQLREMTGEIGWVLCDVSIEKLGGGVQLASERYRYDLKELNGWIQPLLVAGNFIPVMSPLVRRELLGDAIRFHADRAPEDWHFWHAVAGAGRCRYVPHVLATYRKRAGGRNSAVRPHPTSRPGVEQPIRLNLGCGTPDTRSWHPMPGLVNLDRALGWRFEDGLGDFVDGSVAGITVSHSLMYVRESEWPRVFREFARVLEPGGVLRITEDDATSAASSRLGGWRGSEPAVILTDAAMVRRNMEAVGFTVCDVAASTSHFRDLSLCQAQHGEPPDVFFIEGVRECSLVLSPHADDESLFAAFTVIRHRPRVVICFPSAGDYGDTDVRTAESRAAVAILGGGPLEQLDGTDLVAKFRALDARLKPTRVWAPSVAASHPDHVAVAHAARAAFGDRLTSFHTYDSGGKVRSGDPVPFEPGWAEIKRRALACYRTQLEHPRARAFFTEDLHEYSGSGE